MDQPIYGDEYSKYFTIAFWAYTGFFSLTIFATVVILVIYTFLEHWQHAFTAGLIVVNLIPIIGLLIWTRMAYVDPKLKYVTLLLSIIVIFSCAVALMYVWGLRYPGDVCYSPRDGRRLDQYLYRTADNKCYEDISCIGFKDSCASWDDKGNFIRCGRFNRTTLLCR
eukprot:gene237-4483_t